MENFRLISLSNSNPNLFELAKSSTDTGLKFMDDSPRKISNNSDNHFTVIIGKNGIGKSRAIGKVAELFGMAFNEIPPITKHSRFQRHYPTGLNTEWSLQYKVDGNIVHLSNEYGNLSRHSQQQEQARSLPKFLPNKVIALATTATDKFPLKRSQNLEFDPADISEERYSYIGFKDRFGRSSATYAIQRALEAVTFSDQSIERKTRIANIFHFLGYSPEIRHLYRWRISILKSGSTVEEILRIQTKGMTTQRIQNNLIRIIEEDPSIESKINSSIADFLNQISQGQIEFISNFNPSSKVDQKTFLNIKLLRRIGLISFDSIKLLREDTINPIDFREISSGELSILTSFLGLTASIENGSLILIDEPEVSLHPEWQSKYLSLLEENFSDYSGCHFIIATHSPLLISGAPVKNSNTVRIGYDAPSSDENSSFAGESIDEVLLRAFEVVGNNNLYLKQLTIEALRLIADGKRDSSRLEEIVHLLASVMHKMDVDTNLFELLKQITLASGHEVTR